MKLLLVVLAVYVALAAAQAPLYGVGSAAAIQDEYIVVLHKDFTAETRDLHLRELVNALPTVRVIRTYAIGNFVGFAANMDKSALARELEHEAVRYIEANQVVSISGDDVLVQDGADWGLDRISQRDLPLDTKYQYFESQGKGVDAYVVDTGILTTHDEFGGRALPGKNFIAGESIDDCNGHGTHVAGTIGGKTYGVAKLVTLFAVKVLGCSGSGSYDGVIGGIQFVADNAKARGKRSVANMSLGGGVSTAVDQAVAAAVDAGVVFVVAAGNNGLNACNYSPARAPTAVTVGATTVADARASYSNHGPCLDIFAPGTNIKSAWIGSDSATNTISGTSMASPHVAGTVAQHLGHLAAVDPDGPNPTPAQVDEFLASNSTPNKVTSAGTNSPNRLLYSPFQ